MCNNCNCNNFDRCSIVGFMPVGFCCSNCNLYDEKRTCLNTKTKKASKESTFHPISASIKDGILKVIIEQDKEQIPVFIDLKKQLGEK
ncbi:MAG: hypothetical protein KGD57_00550 [Candidatus Lokiarchaeota archaeon]|nr:hypothetical protein [Candidatus Lokiarchaeota archaeon]